MIKLKGKKLINGMNEFALTQHYTRQFPNNLFYSELLSSMGLSMPRYITYKINLNGDDWGLMLAEEHYSSEYYKLRNKNYSPTIKFTNEDNSDLRRSLYANFNTNINFAAIDILLGIPNPEKDTVVNTLNFLCLFGKSFIKQRRIESLMVHF